MKATLPERNEKTNLFCPEDCEAKILTGVGEELSLNSGIVCAVYFFLCTYVYIPNIKQ